MGILSTPAVDLASRAVFLDAMVTPDGGTTIKHYIISLNVDTGAINSGWLSRPTYAPYVLRGWNGVATKVNSIGQVEGTCIGTGLGWDDTFYLNRPTDVNAAHSYGPIFLAGAEIIDLLRKYPNIGTAKPTF